MWFGVFAPASTPADLVSSLNAEINKALQQADVQKRLGDFGLAPTPVRPADLDKLIQQDMKRFGPLVKSLSLVAN